MKYKKLPDQSELHRLFEYHPDGFLINKFKRNYNTSTGSKGRIAGWIETKGYRAIEINRSVYKAHRLIYKMFNNVDMTSLQIDHINHIKDDNRIENLRLVTQSLNRSNTKMMANNTTGYKCIHWSKGKWLVRLKQRNYGFFDNIEDAIAHRDKIAETMNYHKNNIWEKNE